MANEIAERAREYRVCYCGEYGGGVHMRSARCAPADPSAPLAMPKGHDDAKARIESCKREIEIICDTFGYDPTEWLMPDLDALDGDDVPAVTPSAPAYRNHAVDCSIHDGMGNGCNCGGGLR